MKNRTLIILLAILMALSVAACKSEDNDPEIAGLITEATEGSAFIMDVIGGFQEDIMQVYITDKTKYNDELSSSDIVAGNAIGITIEDEVRESYPVQTDAKRILWSETVIKGTILSAGGESLLIMVTEGYYEDLMQVHLNEETLFYNNIPGLMEKQKTIGFTITGDIMESDPVQVIAKRVVIYE